MVLLFLTHIKLYYVWRDKTFRGIHVVTHNFIVQRVGQIFFAIMPITYKLFYIHKLLNELNQISSAMSILSVIIFLSQDFWSPWMIFIRWAVTWLCCRLQTTSSTKSCTTLSSRSRCLPGSVFVWPTWWLTEERNGPRSWLDITRVHTVFLSLIIYFKH